MSFLHGHNISEVELVSLPLLLFDYFDIESHEISRTSILCHVFTSDSVAVSCIPGQRPSVHSQRPGQMPQSSLAAALYRPLQVLEPLFFF